MNRGIESFFRQAFDGLKGIEGVTASLFKGRGEATADEHVLWNLPRTGSAATLLGRVIRRNSYVAEQLSSFPAMVRAIRRQKPDVIFYSDANLGFQLFRWRKQIGIPYRLLFSNGGPVHPPFDRTDYVHQVAPLYYDEAVAAGESPERHRMIPYGISVPPGDPQRVPEARRAVRQKLQLPLERAIVLSVGWIAAQHKRMDYVVREIARLPEPRPYLVLIGAIDEQSEAIISLAAKVLGAANFIVRSVASDQVSDYYNAADLFVLASLQEGFGRVFLEALIHGLPVIAHRHPVMEFVLGEEGRLLDLSRDGTLAGEIAAQIAEPGPPNRASERRASVRRRFSWPVLAPHYRDMFFNCAAIPMRTPA